MIILWHWCEWHNVVYLLCYLVKLFIYFLWQFCFSRWQINLLYDTNSNKIFVSDKPKLLPLQSSIELFENLTYSLSCSLISGSRPVFFEWLHNGHKIGESVDVQVDSRDRLSMLMFANLQRRHSGKYECRARNAFSVDVASTNILIKGLLFLSRLFAFD